MTRKETGGSSLPCGTSFFPSVKEEGQNTPPPSSSPGLTRTRTEAAADGNAFRGFHLPIGAFIWDKERRKDGNGASGTMLWSRYVGGEVLCRAALWLRGQTSWQSRVGWAFPAMYLPCIPNPWGLAKRTHSSGANALQSLNFKLLLLLLLLNCCRITTYILYTDLHSVYLWPLFLNDATYLPSKYTYINKINPLL